ncbi:MAG TPA: hypothetical protein VN442_21190 [Bryobacteraceae bacterium]|nr:hypothetical protein [Bryobacteraceae bacterium]
MIRQLAATLLFGTAAWAQVVITVQNAASWAGSVPGGAAAPGSIVAVQTLRGGPVVINPDVSKLAVKIGERDAPVLGASLGTVLALVPEDLPPGIASVVMTTDGQASIPAQIRIVPVAPGIFATLSQNVRPGAVTVNRLTDPALAGEYITVWGTGLGAARPDEVTVEVGGKPVRPSYAGPAPGFRGLDQINVQLPQEAPDGCYVSVVLKAQDAVSNEITVAKADRSGACEHPFRLRTEQLRALDEGRSVRVGLISLRSEVMPPPGPPYTTYTRNEAAFGELALRTASDAALMAQPLVADEAYYGCRLFNPAVTARFTAVDDFDAGEQLVVTGPGKSLEVPRTLRVVYLNVLPAPEAKPSPKDLPGPFFTAGTWRVASAGGATVTPFDASLPVPPPLRWINRDSITSIDRSVDQAITWEPDGYSPTDVMTATLTSGAFQVDGTARATGMICRAPASAGRLTLPAELLRDLPTSPISTLFPLVSLQLRLTPKPWLRQRFELPLVAGGTESALFEYLFTDTLRTNLR